MYVDGVQKVYASVGTQWSSFSLPITLGVHDVEWRYQRDPYSQGHAAWIDDVAFVGQ